MSMISISISFDEEKLAALDFSLAKENSTAQKRMEQALDELYEKTVPEALREYVNSKSAPVTKPKRPAKQPAPKPHSAPAKPGLPPAAPMKEDDKNG